MAQEVALVTCCGREWRVLTLAAAPCAAVPLARLPPPRPERRRALAAGGIPQGHEGLWPALRAPGRRRAEARGRLSTPGSPLPGARAPRAPLSCSLHTGLAWPAPRHTSHGASGGQA